MSNKELLNLQQLYTFLEHRCNALESIANKPKTNEQRQCMGRKISHSYVSVKPMCEVCKDSHAVLQCYTFKQLSNQEKYQLVEKNKLCINCLSTKHMIKNCQSHGCKISGKWHHTLIHRKKQHSQVCDNRHQESAP